MGNWRVNLKRFRGDPPPFFPRYVRERTHVVGSVCQFDQDDPNVPGHGQQHLAERLRLAFFPGVEMQPVQLGQAINQFGNSRAKPFYQFRFGYATVFNGVVKQSCHQRLGIQPPVCALSRYSDGVGDIRLTVVSKLAEVCFICESVSQAYLLNIGRGQVVQSRGQCGETGRGGVGCGNMDRTCTDLPLDLGRAVSWGVCRSIHPTNIACARKYESQGQKKAP